VCLSDLRRDARRSRYVIFFFNGQRRLLLGLPPLYFGGIILALHWWITAGVLIALALFCFLSFATRPRHSADPDAVVSLRWPRCRHHAPKKNAVDPARAIRSSWLSGTSTVNRTPLAGTITQVKYLPGKFLADGTKAPRRMNKTFHARHSWRRIEFKQIAGPNCPR